MSVETTLTDWADGDMELELDVKITVNYQERGKLYYQVFLKDDTDGEHDIREYLPGDDLEYIETCIIEALEEMDNE